MPKENKFVNCIAIYCKSNVRVLAYKYRNAFRNLGGDT